MFFVLAFYCAFAIEKGDEMTVSFCHLYDGQTKRLLQAEVCHICEHILLRRQQFHACLLQSHAKLCFIFTAKLKTI